MKCNSTSPAQKSFHMSRVNFQQWGDFVVRVYKKGSYVENVRTT